MFYQNYLSGFASLVIGVVGAVIQDLARLMDDSLFAITSHNAYDMVPLREGAYDRFCAACRSLGIALPPLEKAILDYYMPKPDFNADRAETNLRLAKSIRDCTDNELCHAVALMLETFSAVGEDGSGIRIDRKNLLAVANRQLINSGLEPLRSIPELYLPVKDLAFNREMAVLIVDDKPDDIFKTALSLAGWPNLKVTWEIQNSKLPYDPSPEQKEQEVARMVAAIIARKPDIILMDKGLTGISGASLIPGVLRALPSTVVIANTGGNVGEMHAAGAIGSAKKGEDILAAMQEAAPYFRD